MPKTCHFGMQCHTVDCYFQHPRGFRPQVHVQPATCHFGMHCRKVGCNFQHPRNFRPLCRNQTGCTAFPGCKFRHLANDTKTFFKTGPKPHLIKTQQCTTKVQTVGCTARDLFLMLDMSGSMSGRPVEDVRLCAKDIFKSVLKRGDRVELQTFSSTLNPPLMPLGKPDQKQFFAAVACMRASGRTALWTAIMHAVSRAKDVYSRSKKRFVEVVVMTDGDDTMDIDLFHEACALVAKPGCVLKFFMISCGSNDATREQLRQLCSPPHCKLVVEDNVGDLMAAFGKVKRELVTVTKIKTTRLVAKTHTRTRVTSKRF